MTRFTLARVLAVAILAPVAAMAQFTITGVADKMNYNSSATLTVTPQAGYNYSATLNWKPIAVGSAVVVNQPDFYELRVDATNSTTAAVTSQYLRFIVLDPERVGTERGLPTHVPFPVIMSSSNEFNGAHFRVLVPAKFPEGYAIPLVTWVLDPSDKAVRANGMLKASGQDLFKIKRGVGSGFVAPQSAGSFALDLNLQGLRTNLAVNIETNVAWMTVSGNLAGEWTNNSRIQITGSSIIPAGSSLSIGEGTIVRVDAGVEVTNNGAISMNGTIANPIVFMGTTSAAWGGFIQHANNASFAATGTIFTGSGDQPCFYSNSDRGCGSGSSGLGSHRTEQPLVAMNGANCNLSLTDSAAIYLKGQVAHTVSGTGKSYDIRFTRFLTQRATSVGEFQVANMVVNDSALIDFPDESVNFEDEDHDSLYLVAGTFNFTNTLFGWTKDDGIDSGGSGYGPLTYESCWFEASFHEGNSCSGYKNVHTRNTVYFNVGQGIESGYDAPTGRVDSCFFSLCKTGIRHGDNYETFSGYDGRVTATNNISIYNHRDLFGFNWDNSNGGGWTNSFDRFWASNNFVSVLDTNYPNNILWNPSVDGWRLGRFGGVGRVGVGFGARGNTIGQLRDGIPVGLSIFCTNEVQVDYVIDGTDGTHSTGTLVFPAGLTRSIIPTPTNTNAIYRVKLENGVNADVTGSSWYIAPTLPATTPGSTVLVASNAVWRYFDQTNDLGTAWRAFNYQDTAWLSGPAQLGFGESDQATTIASNRQYTTYFRRLFNVPDPTAFASVSIRLVRDDAGVVYINGNEVFRSSNLPAAPSVITNRQLATATGENSIDNVNIAVSNLVAGDNVAAVEIHQESLTSSDLSFALTLTGNAPASRPRLALVRLGDEIILLSSDNTAIIEEATTVTGPWTHAPVQNTPTGFSTVGQKFYRLRK